MKNNNKHSHRPKQKEISSTHASAIIEGRLELKGRVGFVIAEDGLGDVLIDGPTLRLAMADDRVRARVTSPSSAPRRLGFIEKVLEHTRPSVVGAFGRLGPTPVVLLENDTRPIEIRDLHGLKPGDGELVVVDITRWPTSESPAQGALKEVLGPRSEPGVELRALVAKYDLPNEFPAPVEREADAYGDQVDPAAYQGRRTLFDERIFTIDGADAKDFDDAVSLERLPGGGWRLGVHIADVAHYVREGSALDEEAYERGTSVYLSGSVLPMLPFSLSDGLCSLRPEQIRLTLTCSMDIDPQGHIVRHEVYESAIRSARRFTYEQVEQILNGETLPGLSPEIHADVREMGRVAKIVRNLRFGRGSLDFDFPEPYVMTDPQGRPTDIKRRERLEAHRLIEDFMLLANETVARHMEAQPFLYRIHERPDPAKLEKLRKSLEAVGQPAPRGLDSGRPAALQQILYASVKSPSQAMVQMLVLRSLKQAVYSPANKGHFGLASPCYTHFTSPIRRYPDLLVHRLVKERLHGQATPARLAHWKQELVGMTAHCSRRERVAVDAEREYLDVQRVRLMSKHVGETFDGVISSVTNFGLFVQLSDIFVEGLVHVSTLNDDYYIFDEVRMTLRGKRSGRAFHMGQPVKVQLAAANPVKRQLDFELLRGNGAKPHGQPKTGGEKQAPNRPHKPSEKKKGERPFKKFERRGGDRRNRDRRGR